MSRAAPRPPPAPSSRPAAAQAVGVGRAIEGEASLASLLARVAESKRRFETIVPLLPPTLCADVQPGPLDVASSADGNSRGEGGTTWSLLAANTAAASKLRQLAPALEAALQTAGWPATVLKIKVLPRR